MSVLKETNAYRQQLKGRIMETALKAFTQQGIRAVKMDAIASELSISKRTLYEIYEDKEHLLFETIKNYDERKRQTLTEYAQQDNHHVIDIILEAYRLKLKEIRSVNPLFYTDILKYPKLAQYIKNNNERARERYTAFMQRGVDEGYLRPDVNYQMIPYMMEAISQYILTSKLLDKYSFEEMFTNYFLVSLRGLCTQRGIKVIDEAML
ncbi:MAG: TetR/AcrR family transcriptional regulator [Prevotella sp.]|nr:TetR/AcrR family transcriptional regulator [Prevotella sp.]